MEIKLYRQRKLMFCDYSFNIFQKIKTIVDANFIRQFLLGDRFFVFSESYLSVVFNKGLKAHNVLI